MSINPFKWMKNLRNKKVAIQEKKEENIQEATSQADPPISLGRRTSSTLLSTLVEHDEEDSDIELPISDGYSSSVMPNMKSYKDRKRSSSSTASSGYQSQTSRSTLADDTLDTIHKGTLSSSSSASSYFTAQGSMNTISSSRDSYPSFTVEVTTAGDAEMMQENIERLNKLVKWFEGLTARVDKLEGQMERTEKLVMEIRRLVSPPEKKEV